MNALNSFKENIIKEFGIEEKILDFFPKFGNVSILIKKLAFEKKKDLNTLKNEIIEKLRKNKFVEKIEEKNDFLNIYLNYKEILKNWILNFNVNIGNGEKIIVEHTSVNPNKAWHIGHLRNACIGDSIAKLLKFVNYDVFVINYIDDTGAQIADNLVGLKYLNYSFETKEKIDSYFGKMYVEVNKLYEKDEKLKEKRKEILKLLEEGDKEILKLANKMVDLILKAQLETAKTFGIYYDLLVFESHILHLGLWNKVFEMLKNKNLLKFEKEGKKANCWIFELDNEKVVFVRSDGTTTYVAKDVAYALWKHGLIDFDFGYEKYLDQNGKTLYKTSEKNIKEIKFKPAATSINVIDIRQSQEQKVVKEIVEKIAKEQNKKINYVHYAYEVVALSKNTAKKLFNIESDEEIVHMSGRKGLYINADDFLNSLINYLKSLEQNKNLSEYEIKKIAVSIIRWEMEKRNPKSIIIFDLESALKYEQGTAIYVLYTYARLKSILRKAQKIDFNFDIEKIELSEEEKALLDFIYKFPIALEKAAKSLSLTILTDYLTNFCFAINEFYEKHRVLQAEEKLRNFRVWLIDECIKIFEIVFEILGIQKIEKI